MGVLHVLILSIITTLNLDVQVSKSAHQLSPSDSHYVCVRKCSARKLMLCTCSMYAAVTHSVCIQTDMSYYRSSLCQ